MMHSDIYAKVRQFVSESKFNPLFNDVITFVEDHYSSGNWVYPTAIHRTLHIEVPIVYEALELLVSNSLLTPYLEIYCPACHRYTREYFRTLSEIPVSLICQMCDLEINSPASHAVVVYMKI